MKANRWWSAVLCGATLACGTAAAQTPDEPKPQGSTEPAPKVEPATETPKKGAPAVSEPPLHRWGGLVVSVAGWYTDLTGGNYTIANQLKQTDVLLNQIVESSSDPALRTALQARWYLPRDKGAIDFAYDSIRNIDVLQSLTPGAFQFTELLPLPTFAGVADDGRSDGYQSETTIKSRRFRVEYANVAFDSPRARGTWHAGLHSIDHSRGYDASYFAIAPNLPPAIPPVFPGSSSGALLAPRPDTASSRSDFSGSGIGGGLDVEFILHPRVSITGGFAMGIVGGRLNTEYKSTTHTYYLSAGPNQGFLTYEELVAALNDPTDAPFVVQVDAPVLVRDAHSKQFVEDVELYLGIEVKIWKSLKVFIQGRGLAFLNAGVDLRPARATLFVSPVEIQTVVTGVSQETRSVGYGGGLLGISYRF